MQQEREYNNYVTEKIKTFLEKVDIKKKNEIDKAFHKKMIKNSIKFTVEEYNKFGIKSSLVQAFYKDFIHKNYIDLLEIVNFNDFVKGLHIDINNRESC